MGPLQTAMPDPNQIASTQPQAAVAMDEVATAATALLRLERQEVLALPATTLAHPVAAVVRVAVVPV